MKPQILLADDSITIQKVITLTLEGYDVELISCRTPSELDEKLSSQNFDVLLLDYGFSEGVIGSDFIKEMIQKNPRIKILPLLGTFDESASRSLSEIGIEDSISKPFDGNTFIGTLEKVLGYSLKNEQNVTKEESLPSFELPSDDIDKGGQWGQEVPSVIGTGIGEMGDIPSIIEASKSFEEVSDDFEEEVKFPEEEDLDYPDSPSVKEEITSKLVSLDDLDPLGDGEDQEVRFEENMGSERIQDIEEQIEEEIKTDLWEPDEVASSPATTSLNKSEIRLIAQGVVEDYMKDTLKRALKEIVPEIAEKLISKEIEKISERILRDDF